MATPRGLGCNQHLRLVNSFVKCLRANNRSGSELINLRLDKMMRVGGRIHEQKSVRAERRTMDAHRAAFAAASSEQRSAGHEWDRPVRKPTALRRRFITASRA